ncbi:MAG TPA: hypothetical protein VGI10_04170 [Polyangiaceae bacterium]|jgi:ABC-type phosphate transport system substrate-binding protein
MRTLHRKNSGRAWWLSATCALAGIAAHTAFCAEALAADPDCATLFPQHVVYIRGSSAIKPVIAYLAYALVKAGDPLTLVYSSDGGGSCAGVDAVLQTNLTGSGQYWPNDPTADPNYMPLSSDPPALIALCNFPTTQRADIGASDVYPTSCPQIDQSLLTGFYDFDPGFNQSMEFIVSALDDQSPNTISEEAAYLTFGFGADSTTEWSDPNKIFIRDEASGTMQMVSRAIGVPANKFVKTANDGNVCTDTQTMVTQVSSTNTGTIGYIANTDAEASKYAPKIKPLAFQPAGLQCGFYPNSSASTHDKARVRDGHYPIWGRFHVLAPVDSTNTATNPDVARLLDLLSGKQQVAGVNVLDILIANNTIPTCAMHVTRDAEMGPMMSFMPEKSCGCYFDSVTGSTGCQTCTSDADCTSPDTPKCNHWGAKDAGYCEVQ